MLSATDALRRDRILASLDDNQIKCATLATQFITLADS
jgi:hypothetical protein